MTNFSKRVLSLVLAAVLGCTATANTYASPTVGLGNSALPLGASFFDADMQDGAAQDAGMRALESWDLLDQSYLSGGGTYTMTGFYKEAVARQNDGIHIQVGANQNSTTSHYMILNASAPSGFALPAKEFTMEVRARANGETQNRIGVRSGRYYEIVLDAVGGVVKGGGKEYAVDTTQWHDYRFVVGDNNTVFDLYVDGVKAWSEASSASGTGTIIKIGVELKQTGNMDIESVRAATGVQVPSGEGITGITLSATTAPQGMAATLAVTARMVGLDGETATITLMDSDKATAVDTVPPQQATVAEGKAQATLSLPDTLAAGEYYVQVEAGPHSEFSAAYQVIQSSDDWTNVYNFSADWSQTDWRQVLGKNLVAEDFAATQNTDYINIVKQKSGSTFSSAWVATPASFVFPAGAFTVEARLRVRASGENEGNKFALRMDSSRAVEVYLQSEGYTALAADEMHTSSYYMDTTDWHDYRILVDADRKYSLYIDGVLVLDKMTLIAAETAGGDIVKLGGESGDLCNMDAAYVKVGAGVQYPAFAQGVRKVELDHYSAPAGTTVTATAQGVLMGDGETAAFTLYEADGTSVSPATTASGTFSGGTAQAQLTLPGELPRGKYYVQVESGFATQRSSPYTVTGTSGPKPVFPDFQPIGNTIEMADYSYNPTDEFNFPSIVDTSVHGVSGTPLGRYYLYYAPHNDPAGICLATSDSLDGPWTEHGANPLVSRNWAPHYTVSHVSSGDVVWNQDAGKYFMYFHGENNVTRYATSDDLVNWSYGGVCVVAKDFVGDGNEASYARVFDYEIPGVGNKYIMTIMVNNSKSERKIYAAHSVDGITWTALRTPIATPDNSKAPDGISYAGNLSGAFFLQWEGYNYVIAHASSGNIYAFEVGDDLMLEKHWGVLYNSKEGDPDHGRAGAPCFLQDDDGVWHMFYEGGMRLNTNIIHATSEAVVSHTITATAGPGGSISPSGSVSVRDGASRSFAIVPDAGYRISQVMVDDVEQTPVPASYLFQSVTEDHIIQAEFEPDDSDVLFYDDFETGNAEKWRPESGSWSVVEQGGGHVYRQSAATGGANNYAGESTWGDYSVEATLQTETTNAVITLSGRVTDGNNRYSIGFNKGMLAIARKVGGVDHKMKEKAFVLTPGTPYDLKIEFQGNNIRLYVNGELELEAADSYLPTGFIGIATYNSVAWFDNVVVRSLEDTPAPGTFTIKEPASYQVFQRRLDGDGKATAPYGALLPISGTYPDSAATVEVRVVSFGDSQQQIAPWTAMELNQGGFTGAIETAQGGWYRLEARALDAGGDPIESLTGANKWGVGINILCTGQSNMQGQGKPPYTLANDLVSNFRAGSWKHLTDPYDGAGASMVPAMGNALVEKLGIPVGFIPAADSGSGLHQPNIGHAAGRYWLNRNESNHADLSTIYGKAIDRAAKAGGVELIVWNQGETDGRLSIPKDTYKGDMQTLLARFREDLHLPKVPLFLAQIGNHAENLGETSTDLAYSEIRSAQKELDDGQNFFLAATEMEFERVDTAHYTTPGLNEIGARYANAICYYYGLSSYYRGPEIAGAQFTSTSRSEILVDITHRGGDDITPESGITGFYVYDDDVRAEVQSVSRAGEDSITIVLAQPITGTATLRYLFGFNPSASNVVKDNTALRLPMEATTDAVVVSDAGAPSVSFTALNEAIAKAEAILVEAGKYQPATLIPVREKLAAAKVVKEAQKPSQQQVDNAWQELLTVLAQVREQEEIPVDFTALNEAIAKAEAILAEAGKYQSATLIPVREKLAAAKAVKEAQNPSQQQIDAAQQELSAALAQVREQEEIPVDFTTLNDAIAKAEAILAEARKYQSATLIPVREKLAAAKAVQEAQSPSQQQVDSAQQELSVTLAQVALIQTPSGSGSKGGGSSSSSGRTATTAPAAVPNTPKDVTTAQASTAAAKAGEVAKAAGSDTATVRIQNPGNISRDALQGMAKTAGMPVKLHADSMSLDGKAVEARITLDPSSATKSLNLSASTSSPAAKAHKALFQKWFTNRLGVVSLGQREPFGFPVQVAVKLSPDMSTENLVLYSYNPERNSYKRLEMSAHWMDKNGYLHFTTELGGDIVISDGALTVR